MYNRITIFNCASVVKGCEFAALNLGFVWRIENYYMFIAGLQKTTLIDYPGKLACTVFLAGCNFRCPWCYSRELVLPEIIVKRPRISEKEFFGFLKNKKGLLEGVVVCGGEPTINRDLPQFIEKIKRTGYAVKLDTNGSNPHMLERLISEKLVDYVAMDVKLNRAPDIKNQRLAYEKIMGEGAKTEDIETSAEILKKSDVDFEFRTTAVPGVHTKQNFIDIANWIGGKNVRYYIQNFRAEKTVDPEFEKIDPYPEEFLREIVVAVSPFFKTCQMR